MLAGADTVNPSLVPDVAGDYEITLTVSDFLEPGTSASVMVTATTAEAFAEMHLLDALDVVRSLNRSRVKTNGNQRALGNFIRQAIGALQKGHVAITVDKIRKSIDRTDGCPVRGRPDLGGPGKDWITGCDAQAMVYELLDAALWALR